MAEMEGDKGHAPFALLGLGGDVGSGNGGREVSVEFVRCQCRDDFDSEQEMTPRRRL
jgi:hypothetical protein